MHTIQRRQTTWLGDPTFSARDAPEAAIATPKGKQNRTRLSPSGPPTHSRTKPGPSGPPTHCSTKPSPSESSTHPGTKVTSFAVSGGLSSSQRRLEFTTDDPWSRYNKILQVRAGGPVVLAQREELLFAIRCHREKSHGVEKKLYMLQTIQDERFQATMEVFLWREEFFTVSPYIEISVLEITTAPLNPSEAQVACVARQVS
jgi:hypothetical protein